MTAIPISNWWCERCRGLVSSTDVSLNHKHMPKDLEEPRCNGSVEWRTVYVETGILNDAFNGMESELSIQG